MFCSLQNVIDRGSNNGGGSRYGQMTVFLGWQLLSDKELVDEVSCTEY